jgi:PAS domain S-box-containing protein
MLNFDAPFWKQIVEDSLAGVYILDNELRLLYVNNVVERAIGYTKEELYLRKATEIAHEEDREALEKLAKKVFNGERVFYQGRYIKKNREVRWAWGAITPLEYKGRLYGLGNWIDITRVKKLEEKLKESEEFYRTLVEEAIVPIYIVQGGRVVYANKVLENVTGYSKEEIIGKSPFFS